MKKTVTLITGASSGFGLEFCRQYAAAGHNLLIVARRGNVLNELKTELEKEHGITVYPCPADLSLPKGLKAIQDKIQHEKLTVDILINNAGFGINRYFTDKSSDEWREMIEVNIQSVVGLSHFIVNHMKKHGGGKILNIASLAGFQPVPTFAVYAATKSFVLHFSEALRSELEGSSVHVSVLCPGFSKTGFQERAGVKNMPNTGALPPVKIVTEGIAGLKKNRAVIVPGGMNKVLVFFQRLLPRDTVTSIAKKQASQ